MSITAQPYDGSGGDGKPLAPLVRPESLLGEWQTAAAKARRARETGTARGPVTGFPTIDQVMGGAMEEGVHVIHGGTGSGKTAFALQVSAQCGYPVLYVTVEMAPLELLRRTTARVTETFLGRLRSGELDVQESLALARQGLAAIPHVVFMDATRVGATAAWIAQAATQIRGGAESMLLVVDSVHSWVQGAASEAPEYEALTQGVQALQRVAVQLHAPVLAISERNLSGMERGGVTAMAGTRKLGYGAESVIDLDRKPASERWTGGAEAQIQVRLSKNRHGTVGRPIVLLFNGACQAFREGGK